MLFGKPVLDLINRSQAQVDAAGASCFGGAFEFYSLHNTLLSIY